MLLSEQSESQLKKTCHPIGNVCEQVKVVEVTMLFDSDKRARKAKALHCCKK